MADPCQSDKRAQLLQDDEKWPNGGEAARPYANDGDPAPAAANETLQTIAGMMGNVLEVCRMVDGSSWYSSRGALLTLYACGRYRHVLLCNNRSGTISPCESRGTVAQHANEGKPDTFPRLFVPRSFGFFSDGMFVARDLRQGKLRPSSLIYPFSHRDGVLPTVGRVRSGRRRRPRYGGRDRHEQSRSELCGVRR